MTNTETGTDAIRLDTASGEKLEARVILYGERFGPAGRYQNTGARPVVEFRRVGVSPALAYVSSYQMSLFETLPLDVRFTPDGSLGLALRLPEVARLVGWLESLGLIDRGG